MDEPLRVGKFTVTVIYLISGRNPDKCFRPGVIKYEWRQPRFGHIFRLLQPLSVSSAVITAKS